MTHYWVAALALALAALLVACCLLRTEAASADGSWWRSLLGRRVVQARALPKPGASRREPWQFVYLFNSETFYFDFTGLYASAFLAALPVAGYLTESAASRSHAGEVSVSSVIRHEPLATAYAYFGALFLYVTLYYQTQHNNVGRYVLALVGAKGLSLPLILPLLSLQTDSYHIWGAAVGAVVEWLYLLWVIFDEAAHLGNAARPELAVVVALAVLMGVAILLGGLAMSSHALGREMHAYAVIFCEYVFGATLIASAKTIQMYKL